MIDESLDDFRKRYKGTYLFLTVRGEKHLVRYETNNEEDFCFYSGVYGDMLVDEQTARENISFTFPSAGLYNIKNQAHFFSRVPQRQWKRAICSDNANVLPILLELGLSLQQPDINMDTVTELFFPVYPKDLESALKSPLATALNKQFAVSESPLGDDNTRILWFHTSPVGIINPDKKQIQVKHHVFYQEVLDYIRKKEYNWTVTRS